MDAEPGHRIGGVSVTQVMGGSADFVFWTCEHDWWCDRWCDALPGPPLLLFGAGTARPRLWAAKRPPHLVVIWIYTNLEDVMQCR